MVIYGSIYEINGLNAENIQVYWKRKKNDKRLLLGNKQQQKTHKTN